MLNQLVKKIFLVANANFFAQLLPFLALPLLSRLYDSESFGLYGIFLAISMIASQVFGLKLDVAIVKARFNKQIEYLMVLSFFLSALMLCISIIVFFSISKIFTDTLSGNNILVVLTALVSGFFLSVFNLYNGYLNRCESYWLMSLVNIFKSVIMIALSLLLSLYSENGLIWSNFLTGVIFLVFFLVKSPLDFRFSSVKELRYAFYSNLDFVKYYTPHGLLNVLNVNLPVMLLSAFYSPSAVGLYSMANRLLMTPLGVFSVAINRVMYQSSSRLKESGDGALILKQALKIIGIVFCSSVIGIIIFVFFGERLISRLLGNGWDLVFPICLALLPWAGMRAVSGIFSFSPILYAKQKAALSIEMFYVSTVFILILTLGYFSVDFVLTVEILSYVGCAIVFFQLLWYFWLFSRCKGR